MARRKVDLSTFSTLESILKRVEADGGEKSFEVVIPYRVTFHGRRVGRTFAEAVILDRLLSKGFVPVGNEEREGGTLIEFGKQTPFDASSLRTEPPPLDVVARVPALGPLAKTTTRLHPRRAAISDPAASKIGGTFMWPKSEPWPRCDDVRHKSGVDERGSATEGVCPLLVGVVQLNARDFPQVPFKPGQLHEIPGKWRSSGIAPAVEGPDTLNSGCRGGRTARFFRAPKFLGERNRPREVGASG